MRIGQRYLTQSANHALDYNGSQPYFSQIQIKLHSMPLLKEESPIASLPPVSSWKTQAESFLDKERDLPEPTLTRKIFLGIQAGIGRLVVVPFGGLLVALMRFARGYRIERIKEVRALFKNLAQEPGPILICANHLTFIDSALILWALATTPWYFLNYRRFSWNLPAGDFFKKKFRYRVVAYLTKCIFIHRDGSKAHKNTILGVCLHLLRKGNMVTIFPEGRRSRSGTFDREKLTYGVGKLLSGIPRCRVLCIYLRSHKQKHYSNYPPKGSQFKLLTRVITPTTSKRGRQAYFALTTQVVDTLLQLERDYFASV